jgi:hypothetical protein
MSPITGRSSGIMAEQPYEVIDHGFLFAHYPGDWHARLTIFSFPSHIESKMKE